MTPLILPRYIWGNPDSGKHALLVHGLGSSGHTMWQMGQSLAENNWCATAVDLRGHGNAPRAGSYRIDELAGDLLHTTPRGGTSWDLVIGHSIGAAASVAAAVARPTWTARLALLDPALTVDRERQEAILANQLHAHDHITEDEMREQNPHWHPLDIELRVVANRQASRFALERAVRDNSEWDREDDISTLAVPTLIVGGDPKVDSMFAGDYAERVLEKNPRLHYISLPGTGHSVHRDKPADTLDAILRWLN